MNTTAKAQIEALLQYYRTNRAVGHTTTMIEGAANTDCIVIVANEKQAYIRERLTGQTVLSINNLNQRLRGMNKPLAIDNSAIYLILQRLLEEIDDRDQKLLEVKQALRNLSDNI